MKKKPIKAKMNEILEKSFQGSYDILKDFYFKLAGYALNHPNYINNKSQAESAWIDMEYIIKLEDFLSFGDELRQAQNSKKRNAKVPATNVAEIKNEDEEAKAYIAIDVLCLESLDKSSLRWFYETKAFVLSNELSRDIPEEVKNNLDFIERLLKAVNSLGKALNNQKEHDHSEIQ